MPIDHITVPVVGEAPSHPNERVTCIFDVATGNLIGSSAHAAIQQISTGTDEHGRITTTIAISPVS